MSDDNRRTVTVYKTDDVRTLAEIIRDNAEAASKIRLAEFAHVRAQRDAEAARIQAEQDAAARRQTIIDGLIDPFGNMPKLRRRR
jgi:hypothetical protein